MKKIISSLGLVALLSGCGGTTVPNNPEDSAGLSSAEQAYVEQNFSDINTAGDLSTSDTEASLLGQVLMIPGAKAGSSSAYMATTIDGFDAKVAQGVGIYQARVRQVFGPTYGSAVVTAPGGVATKEILDAGKAAALADMLKNTKDAYGDSDPAPDSVVGLRLETSLVGIQNINGTTQSTTIEISATGTVVKLFDSL